MQIRNSPSSLPLRGVEFPISAPSAPGPRRRNNGPESLGVNTSLFAVVIGTDYRRQVNSTGAERRPAFPALRRADLDNSARVDAARDGLFRQWRADDAAASLLSWICDALRCPCVQSRNLSKMRTGGLFGSVDREPVNSGFVRSPHFLHSGKEAFLKLHASDK
jgi:hypothetical protein